MSVECCNVDFLQCPNCEVEIKVFRHQEKTPRLNYTPDGALICKCGYKGNFRYKIDGVYQ